MEKDFRIKRGISYLSLLQFEIKTKKRPAKIAGL